MKNKGASCLAPHRMISTLKEVEQIVRDADPKEGLTAYQVASMMKWSIHGKKWADAPEKQKWFSMGEARAHIQYLLDKDILELRSRNGINYYYLKHR